MKTTTFLLVMCFEILASCSVQKPVDNPLIKVLASKDRKIKAVMDSLSKHELQIRYTQIDRKSNNVIFTDYDFQVDVDSYFYPASTVKFPAAVLALEKLNETDAISENTRFYVEGDSVETTFAKVITEIFAVSDNDAFNRLVEFLGQDRINLALRSKGIVPVRISHRLGSKSENLATKPLIVYENDSTTTILHGSFNSEPESLAMAGIKKGSGFYVKGTLIEEPFDFSLKNYYPVQAQHGLLKRIIFPQNFSPEERFDLSEQQRMLLIDAMQIVPRKVGYDANIYYDGYCKFFMFGDTTSNIPEQFKIYNKVGFAYGTLTDCAYITDVENGIEFMLTATLLVNKNGIFNDDSYEYDEVGIPFLAELGRQLYDHELQRKK